MKRLKRLWILLIVFAAPSGGPGVRVGPAETAGHRGGRDALYGARRQPRRGLPGGAGDKGLYLPALPHGGFDAIAHTLFCNAAVPGASSTDVLLHQVPQALIKGRRVQPEVCDVDGRRQRSAHDSALHSDQSRSLDGRSVRDAGDHQYGQNLGAILFQLRTGLPARKSLWRINIRCPRSKLVCRLRRS